MISSTARHGTCVQPREGGFTITRAEGDIDFGGAPKSYPSIFAGQHYGEGSNTASLPVKVSEIGSARTSARITTAPGAWNAAWDVWVNSTPDSPGRSDDTEIMIWADTRGGPTPIGDKVDTITIEGRAYEVWKGAGSGGTDVLSYVDVATTTPDIALAPFLADSITRGATQEGSYITSVQLGFEPWKGGAGLAIDDFTYTPTAERRSFTTPARPTAGQQAARDQAGAAPAATDDGADQGETPAPAPRSAAQTGGRTLVGAGSGRCADVAGRSTSPGAPLQLWDCQNGNTAQQWTPGQGDALVNTGSHLCLAIDAASPAQGARIEQQTCRDAAPDQQWKTTHDAALLNPPTGLRLDAKDNSTANATPLIAWQCHDAANQSWATR